MRAFLQRFGEREALLALGCIVSGLVFSGLSPYFATPDNLLTIARNSTELLLIGLGMTLLLGIGGIDVSVGSVLGLAAIGIGRLLEAGAPPALAALAGPVAGLALGVVTAFVVVFGRIPRSWRRSACSASIAPEFFWRSAVHGSRAFPRA